ncbi:MAG: PAS domain S-box protein, partial [Chloroflexales bacterium]
MDVSPLIGLVPTDTEDLVHLLAGYSRDIVFRLHLRPVRGFAYISPACLPITGYPQAAFYADPDLWFKLVHPDDRARLAASPMNGKSAQGLIRWQHRDGRVLWVEQAQHFSFDSQGQVQVIEGSIRDVTTYVTAESRLRLLSTAIDAVANAVVIASPMGTIEWVNLAFTRLTGYSAQEAVGQNTRLLRSGRQDPRYYQHLWETILAGRVWAGELLNRRKDGSLYHEEQTITPVLSDGVVTHFVAIKQDVSARVEREREREALLVMTAALRTARTRAEMLPTLLGQTLVLLQALGAALLLRDPRTNEVVCELGVGCWAMITGNRQPFSIGMTGCVMESGRAYRSEQMPTDGDMVGIPALDDDYAVACVPLRAHDAVIGVIGVIWLACSYPMDDGGLRLFAGIADMAASAIQRATLFEQTERRLRRLTGLHTIDQAITSSFDLQRSLSVVLDQATEQLGVDAAAVLLLNGSAQTLTYAVGCGFQSHDGAGRQYQASESSADYSKPMSVVKSCEIVYTVS